MKQITTIFRLCKTSTLQTSASHAKDTADTTKSANPTLLRVIQSVLSSSRILGKIVGIEILYQFGFSQILFLPKTSWIWRQKWPINKCISLHKVFYLYFYLFFNCIWVCIWDPSQLTPVCCAIIIPIALRNHTVAEFVSKTQIADVSGDKLLKFWMLFFNFYLKCKIEQTENDWFWTWWERG